MMLTAWLIIVNILITLANETYLDDGNYIVTKTFVMFYCNAKFTTKYKYS